MEAAEELMVIVIGSISGSAEGKQEAITSCKQGDCRGKEKKKQHSLKAGGSATAVVTTAIVYN